MITYFNGEFVDKMQVAISPEDRGFVFADGIYEVIRSYAGRLFRCEEHLKRMEDGCRALRLPMIEKDQIKKALQHLLAVNQLADASIYLQLTRGSAPRIHRFPPDGTAPTLYMEAKPLQSRSDLQTNGASAITIPDQRWARCDIKSIALLPNVLAQQRAFEAGAFEALLVRDGAVLEASHSNVFFVRDSSLCTAPLNNYILPGITRQVVLEIAERLSLPTNVQVCFEHELPGLEEVFVTSTTMEVLPITVLNGRPVGKGVVGPITHRLQGAFRDFVSSEVGAR